MGAENQALVLFTPKTPPQPQDVVLSRPESLCLYAVPLPRALSTQHLTKRDMTLNFYGVEMLGEYKLRPHSS